MTLWSFPARVERKLMEKMAKSWLCWNERSRSNILFGTLYYSFHGALEIGKIVHPRGNVEYLKECDYDRSYLPDRYVPQQTPI